MAGKCRCLAKVFELFNIVCKYICYQFGILTYLVLEAVQLLCIHTQVIILQHKRKLHLFLGASSPSILCWPWLFSKEEL